MDTEVLPRTDVYEIINFTEESNPGFAELAWGIHAWGYENHGFVKDGAAQSKVFDEGLDKSRGPNVDYKIALRLPNILGQVDPLQGLDAATMRKINLTKGGTALDLPGYQMSREKINPYVAFLLENMEDADTRLKEITALAPTRESSPLAVFELIRDEIHASITDKDEKISDMGEDIGGGQVWFYCIVKETFDSLVENLGPKAMRKIGDPVSIDNRWVEEKIQLIPVVTDVDNFIRDIYDAATSETDPRLKAKQLKSFLFYSEGLGPNKLDADLVQARDDLMAQFAARQKGA